MYFVCYISFSLYFFCDIHFEEGIHLVASAAGAAARKARSSSQKASSGCCSRRGAKKLVATALLQIAARPSVANTTAAWAIPIARETKCAAKTGCDFANPKPGLQLQRQPRPRLAAHLRLSTPPGWRKRALAQQEAAWLRQSALLCHWLDECLFAPSSAKTAVGRHL